MIENLKENFVYSKLPEAVINLDERGLIQAVCGGFQARLEDLRSYGKKLNLFFSVYGLPDPENNVVSVVLRTQQGVVYKRSLDFNDQTPPASDNSALRRWASAQLGIDLSQLGPVQYDRDLLRLVDTSTLEYLASSIGAVMHQSSLLTTSEAQRKASQQMVETYFPRLRIKGTAASFDVLGRVLGFDDVRVSPLWSRLSPRLPADVGNSANDADFSVTPDFYPKQTTGIEYDPLDVRDGPYYGWSGTCTNGTSSTSFYLSVINGFNPWVRVITLGSLSNGTAAHVSPGDYPLSGGAPNLKAYVEPTNSSFRFEALVEGVGFNGLVISAGTVGASGTDRAISIYDRLSSIKYRSSYFDLGMTVDIDKAIEIFGTQPASRNLDIASGSYTPEGVSGPALSPYRAWMAGSIAIAQATSDFYTKVLFENGSVTAVPRVQATGTDSELIVDNLIAAGIQAAQSMEEVRPATRFPRRSSTGLLIDDKMRLACYTSVGTLFSATGPSHYVGSHPLTLLGGYEAEIDVYLPTGSVYSMTSAADPTNASVWRYRAGTITSSFYGTGTYNFSTGTYAFDFPNGIPAASYAVAIWTVTDTEVIRPNPTLADKLADRFSCQVRPEDDDDGLPDEQADEYPWLRQIVGGGELVEIDTYIPDSAPVDVVSAQTAFQNQNGVDVNVYGLESQNGKLRLVMQDRPYDSSYEPGIRAIAYKGTFKNLSTLSSNDTALIRQPTLVNATGTHVPTDYDVLFEAGYKLHHAGIVQDVLVADPVKFFGGHHRTGLVGWLPLNEHPEGDLTVNDVARTVAVEVSMPGVAVDSRKWDADHGWHLDLSTSGTVTVGASRGVGVDFTMSFWIKTTTGLAGRRVLSYSPVFIDLDATGTQLDVFVYDSGGVLVLDHSFTSLVVGTFYTVFIARSSTGYTYALSTLAVPVSGAVSTVGSYLFADVGSPAPMVLAGAAFHDLRIWNTVKTVDEMELVRYHAPVETQVLYPLGVIQTANRGDRWGMRVLNNGWITPDALTPWYRTTRTGLVRRYTSDGSYTGDARFKEVGLGDGHTLPSTMYLGYVVPSVETGGTAVVSGSWGALPGMNSIWHSGSSTLFPMEQSNPVRDRIWITGDAGDNTVYEVSLAGTRVNQTDVTYLKGIAAYRGTVSYAGLGYLGTEQLTGAEVVLAGNGKKAVYSSTAGTVVQAVDTGTSTPPQWLYLNQRTTDSYPGQSRWTRMGYTAYQQGVDITGNPGIVSSSGNQNSAILVSALGDNGRLEFENSSTLQPGHYRLIIDAGNIGTPDEDFDGFNVELNLNENILNTTLLSGVSGFNARGTNSIELDIITPAVAGTWLLSVTWFNALRDASKGTMRQLAIYGYRLERLATEMFRVEINPADTHCNVFPVPYADDNPGGWVKRVDSYGHVASVAHEGTIYASNDTMTNRFPLSDVLTGLTNDKREDIVLVSIAAPSPTFFSNGTITADAAPIVPPSFGVLINS